MLLFLLIHVVFELPLRAVAHENEVVPPITTEASKLPGLVSDGGSREVTKSKVEVRHASDQQG